MLYHKTTICNYFKTVRLQHDKWKTLAGGCIFKRGCHLKKEKELFMFYYETNTEKWKYLTKYLIASLSKAVETMGKLGNSFTARRCLDADLVECDPVDKPVFALLHQTHAWGAALHHLQLPAKLPVLLIQLGPCLETPHQCVSWRPSLRNSILPVRTHTSDAALQRHVSGACFGALLWEAKDGFAGSHQKVTLKSTVHGSHICS